jgi:hypothetical protein
MLSPFLHSIQVAWGMIFAKGGPLPQAASAGDETETPSYIPSYVAVETAWPVSVECRHADH